MHNKINLDDVEFIPVVMKHMYKKNCTILLIAVPSFEYFLGISLGGAGQTQ